jgi:hypothetical protein
MSAGEATREFYREQGRRQERERIIKLLEAEIERLEKWTDYPAVNALINIRAALIKGEK